MTRPTPLAFDTQLLPKCKRCQTARARAGQAPSAVLVAIGTVSIRRRLRTLLLGLKWIIVRESCPAVMESFLTSEVKKEWKRPQLDSLGLEAEAIAASLAAGRPDRAEAIRQLAEQQDMSPTSKGARDVSPKE